jgi:glycerate-2-kinase
MRDGGLAAHLGHRQLRVVAVGKAAPFMAAAFSSAVSGQVREGIVVGTHLSIELPAPFEWLPAGHPLPDGRSVEAGRRALGIAAGTSAGEMLLVLLSGGASALMAVPAGSLTLDDKRGAVDALLKAGADIGELNTVRKHLSAVKGGRLAAAVPGRVICLAISDVVGDEVSVIGSGPTVPDPSTYADAWRHIERLGVKAHLSPSVTEHLQAGLQGRLEETPKPDDVRLQRSVTRVIGGRTDAMRGAREAAEALGYAVSVLDEPVVGEARIAGPLLVERAHTVLASTRRPACLIASGETTVCVTGGGRGGRNQEMALAAAVMLAGWSEQVALASVGTDGIDGTADAAGAFCDNTSIDRAHVKGLDAAAYLVDNNSYGFFQALGDLIITGPTTTNVGDIQMVLFR